MKVDKWKEMVHNRVKWCNVVLAAKTHYIHIALKLVKNANFQNV